MPSSSSTYEGITPNPPSVVSIRHGIFEPTDQPGLSVSVPTNYDLYVAETAPSGSLGRNGDWYIFIDSDSLKTYRKVAGAWDLVSTVEGGGGSGSMTDEEVEEAYNNQVSVVSQAEAEAGVSTTVRRWTAQRIAQAIAALGGGGGGTGDVVGPASSVDSRPALFDGITGKLLKQASAALGTAAFASAGDFDASGAAAAAQAAAVQRANHTGSQAISTVTGLQTALDGKVDENAAITGATKTKITYDAKGLVTAGADATTADIADSSNKRYVTDAQLVVIGNTSGTNTGDSASQPLDSDLTAIAALTTTSFGRSFLELANSAAGRTLLDLVIGTHVQAYDADLTTWAGLTPSANAQSLVTAADYAAMRTLLGLVIGTNVQAYDADLTTWAGITPGTGVGTFLATPSSANLRAALTDEVGTGPAMFTRTGVVREVWIPAGAMTPTTTNGAATGSYTPSGADVATVDVFAFDDTTAESVQFTIAMPAEWDRSTVKVKAYWTSTSGTGNVEFEVAAGAASDDDALGAILGTAVAIIDTVIASNDLHISPASGAITVGGTPALDDLVLFKISRDPGTASDKTGDALLIGVKLQYTESTTEPSAW